MISRFCYSFYVMFSMKSGHDGESYKNLINNDDEASVFMPYLLIEDDQQ